MSPIEVQEYEHMIVDYTKKKKLLEISKNKIKNYIRTEKKTYSGLIILHNVKKINVTIN